MKHIELMKAYRSISMIIIMLFASTANSKDFVVGVEQISYLPYYEGTSQSYVGFSRDLFDKWAKDLDHNLTFLPLPVGRLYIEYLRPDSNIDFKFPDHPKWNLEGKKNKQITYSTKIVNNVDGILVPKEKVGLGPKNINSISTMIGFTLPPFPSKGRNVPLKIFRNNTIPGVLKQVLSGRVDGSFLNISVANYFLNHSLKSPGMLVFDKSLPYTNSYYFLSSIKHKQEIESFNRWIGNNKELIRNLAKKWGVPLD